jgi:ABC-type sugar transport system ATPase subunit
VAQPPNPVSQEPLLRVEGLSKVYPPATQALRDFELTLAAGEIHGLAGVNGAGKSTAIKLLSGVERPTRGEIWLAGEGNVQFHSPADAHRFGIGVVHQELPLLPNLTAAENAAVGLEAGKWLSPRRSRQLKREYRLASASFATAPRADARLETLGVYAWQVVAIIRALRAGAKLLILDEPTSSLNTDERRALHQLLRQLAAHGTSVLYVSHFLEDVLEIADRVTVLRDGRIVSAGPAAALTPRELLVQMVGERDVALMDKRALRGGDQPMIRPSEGLVVVRLQAADVGPVDLSVGPGECVGLYGLAGSGASALLEAIFGLRRSHGEVRWKGVRLPAASSKRIKAGLGFVSGDRKRTLLPEWTVSMNHGLPWAAVRPRRLLLDRRAERRAAEATIAQLAVVGVAEMRMRALSGGNQQKLSLGRWLVRDDACLLADEPTRGVDARGRAAIHEVLLALAAQGNALLVHSTDPEELVALCHRVLAFAGGEIVGEVAGDQLTVASLEHAVRSRDRISLRSLPSASGAA